MAKILVTRRLPSAVIAKLEAAGTVDLPAGDVPLPYEELCARLADTDAVVTMLNDRIDRRALDGAPQLRIVANVAVGFNNVDVAYARSRRVTVTNTPGVLTESVADFTWALILAVTRRLGEGEREVRAGKWTGWALDYMLGMELRGKQLGIVGMGRIGRAVAEKAPAFGMRVAYAARKPVDLDGAEHMPLDRLLATSDVVSLHCPMTEDTRHLINEKSLMRMKRTAYLINTSRGPVVDEAALARALRDSRLAGAALDVYEREPIVHPDLLPLDNVLLIPHLASATTETRTAMADLAVSNVLAVLGGKPAMTPV
jgi:glyoxylate reductase